MNLRSPGSSESVSHSLANEAARLKVLLSAGPPVTALCHESPDADTIGSAVAMALAAQQLGCEAEVVAVDGIPPTFDYLTTSVRVERRPTMKPGVAIVCDAASLSRVGRVLDDCRDWFAGATIVNVDHHVTNDRFGSVNLVDPDAAASCEIVAETIPRLGVALDAQIASAVLAGLIRDSQGFSSDTTRASALRAAATTVEAGAPIEDIYRRTLLELSVETMRLWGSLLASAEATKAGRVVYTTLTDEHLASTGTEQHDADGVVEFLARGRGVRVAILFRDLGEGTRVSIRTGPGVDAAAIAAEFGGGGHSRRSGCTVPEATDRAIQLILDATARHVPG